MLRVKIILLQQGTSLEQGRIGRSAQHTLLVPLNNITDDEEGQFAAFQMASRTLSRCSRSTSNTHSIQHTVRRGETLSKIARRYCVSLDNLKLQQPGT